MEPTDKSYFWYVFNVDFDFTKLLHTNKLKFTYDLSTGKQYIYGLGFNVRASLTGTPPQLIYGLGFNDNI
jgi:hypothetical protein